MQDVVEAETKLAEGYQDAVQRLANALSGEQIKSSGDNLRTDALGTITKVTLAMTEANDNLKHSYRARQGPADRSPDDQRHGGHQGPSAARQ